MATLKDWAKIPSILGEFIKAGNKGAPTTQLASAYPTLCAQQKRLVLALNSEDDTVKELLSQALFQAWLDTIQTSDENQSPSIAKYTSTLNQGLKIAFQKSEGNPLTIAALGRVSLVIDGINNWAGTLDKRIVPLLDKMVDNRDTINILTDILPANGVSTSYNGRNITLTKNKNDLIINLD